MKDFLKNELQIGDHIVYCRYNRTSAGLIKGRVIDIFDKMLKIIVVYDNGGVKYINVYPNKVVKI